MMNRRRPNALLIEIIIVVLFFSLSAAITLQLFLAAHERSTMSDTDTSALLAAEDIAERFAASGLSPDGFFREAGFASEDGRYVKAVTSVSGRALRMTAEGGREEAPCGVLDRYTLSVADGARACATIPLSRYVPGEVLP